MDDKVVVKYVKIDGQTFENPVPHFEYATKIGTWSLVVETERYASFFTAREGMDVEVEIGMQLGILRDVGRVRIWRGTLPDAPAFVARVMGNDPMSFTER